MSALGTRVMREKLEQVKEYDKHVLTHRSGFYASAWRAATILAAKDVAEIVKP